jgi:hypothetical protein
MDSDGERYLIDVAEIAAYLFWSSCARPMTHSTRPCNAASRQQATHNERARVP